MSHRISLEEAKELRENEIKSQELNRQGIKPKKSRKEKKYLARLSKTERFMKMLKDRGGHFSQKEEK